MMKIREAIRHFMAGLVALTIVGAAAPAVAATASDLFEDGNRLFREDLYWAALLRYREAADAGMDTPLLHYNTGVAHYKAQQYDRARLSLEKAAKYGPLSPVAHYNLGLNAYAAGALEEAMDWFRRAASQDDRKDIARLARKAMGRLRDTRAEEAPVIVARTVVREEYEFTNFDFQLRTGFGMDDNVFRTPAEPYIDVSDPNNPEPVVPEVQSGTFIPVTLSARYQVNALENEGFFGSYRFGGRFYQDETLNNADEHLQELAFGSEYNRRSENRATRVYSAFKIAQHDENYYDPDNGAERFIDGVDISDRMNFLRYGPEFWGRKRFGRFTFGARAKGQLWDYEEVEVVPEYDHEFWNMGLHTDIRMTSTSLLRLTGEYYTRRFSDRPSFELDGTQPLGNPAVRYDYVEFAVEARQRVTDSFWFGLGYSRTDREDRHAGYNNYVRDEYAAQFRLSLGQRFRLGSRVFYQNYNYENAFAFHEPTAGRKTLERLAASVNASYRITDSFEIVGEYFYRDVATNDTRLAYTRGIATLALRWMPWTR
jgi:tetratricopeptide (TPR) repeat protein